MAEEDETERTLTLLREAHLYSLPPRPSSGGWRCQDWPKSNHIFTGRIRVVAAGKQCSVRIEDPSNGTLFATVPVSNENPEISVEPVSDSSRYFVIRVSDGSGRHAFLGLGFVERNDAFDLNVTIQQHVKHVRYEAQMERQAEAGDSTGPPKDFSLKGSVSIALPTAVAGEAPKHRDKPVGGPACTGCLLLPPPPAATGGGGRRLVAYNPAAAPAPTPASAADPFGTDGDSWATFG
eukprot:scaffold15200_cov111-Isochrysis_galbana.AAC.9